MSSNSDLDQIRTLVNEKRLERGGGAIPETYTDAAKVIGCAQPTLHAFLNSGVGIDVAMCIRLARYLELPRDTILRLAGHEDIANMLAEPDPGERDPYLNQIAKDMKDLAPDGKRTVASTVRNLSKALRPHHVKSK